MALDMYKTNLKQKTQLSQHLEITEDIVNSDFPIDPYELLGERSFGEPRDVPVDEIGTPIQEFFRDATVFITGGTGFMGKTLTEKLLRTCPHLKRIYLLIRPKKGKETKDRLPEIFTDRLFWRLKAEVPNFIEKVSAVGGDVSLPGLGISDADRKLLANNVNVVFHGAATVRFDEHIKMAMAINVCGVQAMISLVREMKHLKAFVHVSTAFTHCTRRDINEEFYPVPVKYENIIKLVNETDNATLEAMTPKILNEWPNTYTFTKALAEDVIQNEGKGLPLAVFRPAVIISTYKEPVRGWIDNVYGPIGMVVGIGTGVLHTNLLDMDNVTDMVPVDLVVNSLIAAAWNTGKAHAQKTKKDDEFPIYNYVSSAQNPVSWNKFMELNYPPYQMWPTIRAIWYLSYLPTKHRNLFFILNFFLHTIPGIILDAALKITGKEPMLGKIYDKFGKAAETLEYFAKRRWNWTNKNVQKLYNELSPKDAELFFFDMAQMKWEYYAEACALGLRVYLVNDDIDTLPAARKKWQRLFIAHWALKIVLVLVLYTFIKAVFLA